MLFRSTKVEVEVEVERGSVGITLSCKGAEIGGCNLAVTSEGGDVCLDARHINDFRQADSCFVVDVEGSTLKCELGDAVDQRARNRARKRCWAK